MGTSPKTWELKPEHRGDNLFLAFTTSDVVLDEANSELLDEALARLIEQEGRCRLTLDLGNVVYLTSTTLGIFLQTHRNLQQVGGSLSLVNVPRHLYEVFVITQLVRLMEVQPAPAPSPRP